MPRLRVKVCCIGSVQEARLAVDAGADALGLVSAMPSGPGPISEEAIAAIVPHVPPPVGTFLLTCRQDVTKVVHQLRRTRCNTVQLCDELQSGTYAELREAVPFVRIVQVIHVDSEASVDQAVRAAPDVDAILLDSGRPSLATKELGGTGRVHDWQLSRRIREAVGPTPVFLAGGLNEANVAEAITAVRPFGIDLCSGVRTDRRLDAGKLGRFFDAVRRAQ